jgi:steroid 5-alpha reductase family enzyme
MLRTILILIGALIVAIAMCLVVPFSWHRAQSGALLTVGSMLAFWIGVSFVVGEITRNYSQVDKLWSLLPIATSWHFTFLSGFSPRMILMSALITLWGVRLTYNFGRKGGYQWKFWLGEEDYRWAALRQNALFQGHPWRFRLFHLFFICGYQLTLIFLFTVPVLFAWGGQPLGVWDGVLVLTFLVVWALQSLADEQQFRFQTEKHRRLRDGHKPQGRYGAGFIHDGLWAYCRHPNYACEQLTWILIYAFSVIGSHDGFNPSIIGCILLMLLFVGSSDFSEGISTAKYPAYQDYIARTPRFWPRPWGQPFELSKTRHTDETPDLP